jgi:hypothetical protein
MGIIVSSFIGCGREFFKNVYGDKIKIFDAVDEIPITDIDGKINSDLLDGYVNETLNATNNSDIVFIDFSNTVRNAFNERNIDYDLFYPSKERKNEFIENQVIKRTKPKDIQTLDRNFEKWVDEIDDDKTDNCYKHKLANKGEFIGNTPLIMQYIDSLKQ